MNEMTKAVDPVPRLQRARGCAEITVASRDGRTVLRRLYQSGCAKAILPRTYSATPEAVIINTSGGLTGGDRLDFRFEAEKGARLTVTTQAAERIYRARDGVAQVDTTIRVGAGAGFAWLPQETILFEGGALARRLEIDLAPDAHLYALETVIFGRAAMGERVTHGHISDQWRIRRDGRLIHAEALHASGDFIPALSGRASLAGLRASATLVHAAPGAEACLEHARDQLAPEPGTLAALTAKPGLLIARFAAPDAAPLRKSLIRFLMEFRRETLPRVWSL
jgi:urease accessory protein